MAGFSSDGPDWGSVNSSLLALSISPDSLLMFFLVCFLVSL